MPVSRASDLPPTLSTPHVKRSFCLLDRKAGKRIEMAEHGGAMVPCFLGSEAQSDKQKIQNTENKNPGRSSIFTALRRKIGSSVDANAAIWLASTVSLTPAKMSTLLGVLGCLTRLSLNVDLTHGINPDPRMREKDERKQSIAHQ